MKWLLIVMVSSSYQYGLTTEKFSTKQECDRIGSIITDKAGWVFSSEKYFCVELKEEQDK